jgi:hypothetical protein
MQKTVRSPRQGAFVINLDKCVKRMHFISVAVNVDNVPSPTYGSRPAEQHPRNCQHADTDDVSHG